MTPCHLKNIPPYRLESFKYKYKRWSIIGQSKYPTSVEYTILQYIYDILQNNKIIINPKYDNNTAIIIQDMCRYSRKTFRIIIKVEDNKICADIYELLTCMEEPEDNHWDCSLSNPNCFNNLITWIKSKLECCGI